jgi:hypothetical protein
MLLCDRADCFLVGIPTPLVYTSTAYFVLYTFEYIEFFESIESLRLDSLYRCLLDCLLYSKSLSVVLKSDFMVLFMANELFRILFATLRPYLALPLLCWTACRDCEMMLALTASAAGVNMAYCEDGF